MSVVDDGRCFACGPLSERGLHLRFAIEGEGRVVARTTLAPEFQGWAGVAHGGIAMMLIDEAMAHAVGASGVRGVSADVRVRFRHPVPLGEQLRVAGHVVWRRRNVFGVEATVADEAGRTLLSGEGRFVARGEVVPGELGAGTG